MLPMVGKRTFCIYMIIFYKIFVFCCCFLDLLYLYDYFFIKYLFCCCCFLETTQSSGLSTKWAG